MMKKIPPKHLDNSELTHGHGEVVGGHSGVLVKVLLVPEDVLVRLHLGRGLDLSEVGDCPLGELPQRLVAAIVWL